MNIPHLPSVVKIEDGSEEGAVGSTFQERGRHFESFTITHTETENFALPEATRRQMNFVKNQFEAWYEALYIKSVNELTKPELAGVLKQYYITARKKDGSNYKLCSYLTIRRCLSLVFQYDYGMREFDIQSDPEFLEANKVFNDMVRNLRGLQETMASVNESWYLTPGKIIKLYQAGQLDFYNTTNPKVLLQTVFFNVCYYTGIGKLSVMRRLEMSDVDEVQENGKVIAYNFHLRKYLSSEKAQGPFMINQIPGKPWCPVLTIQQYLSHRNSLTENFFQKPIPNTLCSGTNVWYKKCRYKDFLPLASMCQEAGIVPALSYGCFNKRRISTEVRFELTPIYEKLFPAYFNGTTNGGPLNGTSDRGPPLQKSNIDKKRKKAIKTQAQKSQPVQTIVISDQTDSKVDGTSNVQVRGPATTMGNVNVSFPNATTSSDHQANRGPAHTSVGSLQNHAVFNGYSTSVAIGKVFSCNPGINDAIAGTEQASVSVRSDASHFPMDRPSMVGHDLNRNICNQVSVSTSDDQDVIEIINSSDGSFRTSINNHIPQDQPETSYTSNSQNHPQATHPSSSLAYSYPPNQQSHASQRIPKHSSDNQVSMPPKSPISSPSKPNISQSQKRGIEPQNTSTPKQTEPAQKRSRFDTSNYTFLQNISASAREQGKGAVMLLLRMLDDLSNDNGKELLKDILQEMKII